MYIRFQDGKERALTLSYDDGAVFDMQLVEIMNRYGLKGTFNINTGKYHPENSTAEKPFHMTRTQTMNLFSGNGHEVAVHGLTHPFLEQLTEAEMIREILEDRQNIERDFGTLARGSAYPYGTYDDRVIRVLKACGICYSRTVRSTGNFNLPEEFLTWNPTCHHDDARLWGLVDNFLKTDKVGRPAKLFYLWGHSFEFDRNNNWERLEEFGRKLGGRDDVWYATNIEIYDYVKAYESLQVSYDQKILHNPSAIDVWVYIDGETVKIPSGQTVRR